MKMPSISACLLSLVFAPAVFAVTLPLSDGLSGTVYVPGSPITSFDQDIFHVELRVRPGASPASTSFYFGGLNSYAYGATQNSSQVDITRIDGGAFTYNSVLQWAFQGSSAALLKFQGYLNGTLVGSETYSLSTPVPGSITSYTSQYQSASVGGLDGVTVDKLVMLPDFTDPPTQQAGFSNLTLTPVVSPNDSDFNGDGKPDIVLQNSVTRAARIWYMNGASRIGGVSIGTPPADTEIVGIGDFNSDQKFDIVLQNTVTRAATVWYMNGATQTGSAGLAFIPADFKIVAIADFNSDGKPDLVLQNSVTGAGRIWFMDGRIRTGGVAIGGIPGGFRIATAGDFNGDGKPDLVIESAVTGARRIWFMDGTVHTGGASLGVIPTDWSFVGSGDFNADGKADLILQNSVTGAGRFWYMNGATRTGSAGLAVPTDWQIRN